jgi:TonB family protein
MCAQLAKAQKTDSVVVYLKNMGKYAKDEGIITLAKDSSDYTLLIMTPPDSSTGVKINAVKEFSTNNKLLLTGTAVINIFKLDLFLKFEGPCISFYPNGNRKNILNYKDNKEVGDITEYYLNGNLYAQERHRKNNKLYLIECHDTTGKVLAIKGNGNWVKFDSGYKHKFIEGPVKDSLEEGKWNGFINDTLKYSRIYHKGEVVPTTDTTGQIYVSVEQMPEFYGGTAAFFKFLGSSIHYPLEARTNQIQGKVYVNFIIEKDGSITNVTTIAGSKDASLKNEAIRVVRSSPAWQPGLTNGIPVRVKYTVPISFYLGN